MKAIIPILLLAIALGGCSRSAELQQASQVPRAESWPPDVAGALQFFSTNYPTLRAQRIDDRTIGVIWESGAQREFEAFRVQMKKEFGVDSIITATE
jgi:hypothetical protein